MLFTHWTYYILRFTLFTNSLLWVGWICWAELICFLNHWLVVDGHVNRKPISRLTTTMMVGSMNVHKDLKYDDIFQYLNKKIQVCEKLNKPNWTNQNAEVHEWQNFITRFSCQMISQRNSKNHCTRYMLKKIWLLYITWAMQTLQWIVHTPTPNY